MKANGLEVDATPEQILQELKMGLAANGIERFSSIKPLRSNVQFTCPFHGGGMERKPSCGMTREVTLRGGKAIEAGTVHCFACDYTGGLTSFISDCFGRTDGGMYGNQWLKKHFTSEVETTRELISFDRGKKAPSDTRKKVKFIKESELESYRYFHDYMFERGLTEDIIELFDVGYDEEEDCITFPVRNEEGKTVFIQRRSVKTKFHKYGEDDPKTEYLYGAYEISKYYPDANEIMVTESIINCLIYWVNNIPAVSTMGVGGGLQYELLKKMKARSIVLSFDPDRAGSLATEKAARLLKGDKLVSFIKYPKDAYENKLDVADLRDRIDELEISSKIIKVYS